MSLSSLWSVTDDGSSLRTHVDEDGRCKSIIPGVMFRRCQTGSDWTSARGRRIHRLLLITLPSLPLLVAALVSSVHLQHRYDILVLTGRLSTFAYERADEVAVSLEICLLPNYKDIPPTT